MTAKESRRHPTALPFATAGRYRPKRNQNAINLAHIAREEVGRNVDASGFVFFVMLLAIAGDG